MKDIQCYDEDLDLKDIIEKEEELLDEQGLMLCDLSDIIDKYELWHTLLPNVQPFYAVKCNDEIPILKILQQLGCGFDCASKRELVKVKSLGVPNDHIIFANPCKPKSHLLYARENGVSTMTFDGSDELIKIKKYFPDANLVLRIRCDADQAYFPLGDKFGCDYKLEAIKLLHLAKELNLKIVGICFHVGDQCMEFKVFDRALERCSMIMKEAEKIGFKMKILDIGGGFPGFKDPIFQAAKIIKKALQMYFSDDNDLRIIAEPGRYFVETAQTLITEIHSRREIWRNDKLVKIMYFINDGTYGSLNYLLFKHDELVVELYKKNSKGKFEEINIENSKKYESVIWGPTCDAIDRVISKIDLPRVDIGTKFIVKNTGAYSNVLASGFNDFPIPTIKFYIKEHDMNIFDGQL